MDTEDEIREKFREIQKGYGTATLEEMLQLMLDYASRYQLKKEEPRNWKFFFSGDGTVYLTVTKIPRYRRLTAKWGKR